MWLVAGEHFALLSGLTVPGHRRSLPFSTVPLVFVLALLKLIGRVLDALRRTFERTQPTDEYGNRLPFVTPPVLVVMETNYAYGAAVYQQILWMVDRHRGRDASLRDVDIVFATPVYMWDRSMDQIRRDIAEKQQVVDETRRQWRTAKQRTNDAWPEHRMRGRNREKIIEKLNARFRLQEETAEEAAETRVVDVHATVDVIMAEVGNTVVEWFQTFHGYTAENRRRAVRVPRPGPESATTLGHLRGINPGLSAGLDQRADTGSRAAPGS